MGITKTNGFESETVKMAEILKAIGHPARLTILTYLAEINACVGSEIVDVLPLAQPTISRHLAELKAAGLIKGSIEGKNVCYCINEEGLSAVKSLFDRLTAQLDAHKNCC